MGKQRMDPFTRGETERLYIPFSCAQRVLLAHIILTYFKYILFQLSPNFSSVHHEKCFFLSEVVLNSYVLRNSYAFIRQKKKKYFQNFVVWAAHCGLAKPADLFFCPHRWENSIFRAERKIIGASHRTTNNGLAHFSLFLFLLLFLFSFSYHFLQF